ncbi:cytochrome c oxidase assembly protein [Paenibacillus lutrae]|uniref:Cytochrome c oxidase assembly protein n=1 Tax=Paenibacillus lutrae TaxID=2078573 RepID=A0A7X3JXR6_9BACL|nr:cytochrome c oxidase assembly protein [Paenibacillus lutrae]MVO98328.1 cytochrome c oxidase assembly protein [Paenibacillus lutrae]
MNHNHMDTVGFSYDFIWILLCALLIALYFMAARISNRQYRSWPLSRYFFWTFGVASAAAAVGGPLANLALTDFKAHMAGHLLLGMLAPLLLALAAPMTLLLRTLSLRSSRRLSRLLKSRPLRILSDPVTATLLNIGGLYILYTTDLFLRMHESLTLHIFIHIHVFLAGYLFTISIIYIDPSSHRTSYRYRAVVCILALAAHGILAKYIYSHPPAGVPLIQAETGAKLMYYGGDLIEIVFITIFCFQWYKATRPRKSVQMNKVTIDAESP